LNLSKTFECAYIFKKHIAIDVAKNAYPTIPLSGNFELVRRYRFSTIITSFDTLSLHQSESVDLKIDILRHMEMNSKNIPNGGYILKVNKDNIFSLLR